MLQPWRSFGLIIALIASFALPAFMAASADVVRLAAADSITRQTVEELPGGLDAAVLATGRLSEEGVQGLNAAMTAQLARVDRLGEPTHPRRTGHHRRRPVPRSLRRERGTGHRTR